MAETYKDLKSFLRVVILSRFAPSGTSEEIIEALIEAAMNGSLGPQSQAYFEEHGEYPTQLILDPSVPEPRIGYLHDAQIRACDPSTNRS